MSSPREAGKLPDPFAVRETLKDRRRAGWFPLLLAIALYAAVVTVANLEAFGPIAGIVADLESSTRGWLGPQLVYPWMTLGLVSIAIFAIGRLRAEDVGWRARAIVPALAITGLFWCCAQVALVLVVASRGGEPRWSPWWAGSQGSELRDWWFGSHGSVVRYTIEQVVGVVLLEETFFRGVVLAQVHLQLARVVNRSLSFFVALVVSSTLFVLSHVPIHLAWEIADEKLAEELLWIFPWGTVLALVFVLTRNLFLCVGLHTLWNARPTLIDVPWETVKTVWWVLTIALLVGWKLRDVLRERRMGREERSRAPWPPQGSSSDV